MRVHEKRVAVGIDEVEWAELPEGTRRSRPRSPGAIRPTAALLLTYPTVLQAVRANSRTRIRNRYRRRAKSGVNRGYVVFDAGQIAVVREHMRASAELALEGLRISQRCFSLSRLADVRDHEIARRPVLLHKPHQTAFRRRDSTRAAETRRDPRSTRRPSHPCGARLARRGGRASPARNRRMSDTDSTLQIIHTRR